MNIKRSLIGALAITVVLGISSLDIVNADDSSSIETTTPSTTECPQDGTGAGAKNGNKGCRQNEQVNQDGQGK